MFQIVKEDDVIVVENTGGIKTIQKVKEGSFYLFKKYKIKLDIFSLIGKKYNVWYKLNEDHSFEEEALETSQKEIENEQSINEHTFKKYSRKKHLKKIRSIRILNLTPETLFSIWNAKCAKDISNITLPELAYVASFFEVSKKTLVFDSIKGLLSFTLLYKSKSADITVNSKHHIHTYLNREYNTLEIYKKNDFVYENVFIVGNFNIIELLDFYESNIGSNIVIRCCLREQANQVFEYLLKHKNYINVRMCDFFFREFQTLENIHPLVRSNINSGYVISANKILNE